MLKNYLTVAVRNLLRHKMYSLINIVGLAIGITCAMLILLFVMDELSYDRYHPDVERIYRVIQKTERPDSDAYVREGASGPLADFALEEIPEIDVAVRFFRRWSWMHYEDKHFRKLVSLVDADFLNLLHLPLVRGQVQSLEQPGSIFITEEMAQLFFGEADPMGKTLSADYDYLRGEYTVVGILKDMPDNTDLHCDFLTTTRHVAKANGLWEEWHLGSSWAPVQVYVKLRENASALDVESKLTALLMRQRPENDSARYTSYLQPLLRLHLYGKVDYGLDTTNDIQQVYALTLLGTFILIIACINFMNLATARSVARAREVGVRKVIGAFRSQLIRQFLGESVLLALLSMVCALALVELTLPLVNAFTEKSLSFFDTSNLLPLVLSLAIAIGVGLLAGSYPALFLSAFQPVHVLKGKIRTQHRSALVRKSLVVCQFAISTVFIAATSIVYYQLDYVQNKDLGFHRDQIVLMPIFRQSGLDPTSNGALIPRAETLKQEFRKHPNVITTSVSGYLPGIVASFRHYRFTDQETSLRMPSLLIDEDFFETYDVEMASGRAFSKAVVTDATQGFIINETAARLLGVEDPIGKSFEMVQPKQQGTIVGVVKDFHVRSLKEKMSPLVLYMNRASAYWLVARIKPQNISETLSFFEKKWDAFLPQRSFYYEFLNDRINEQYYESEMRLQKITISASLLAMFVACLGLFGLASFEAQQRTKEIGIRKVLGASVSGIITLLSNDFLKLVLVANMIAWPVAYFAMREWLKDFVYRIDLGLGLFVLSGCVTLLIALLTVSYQAVKAARANPVDALRNE